MGEVMKHARGRADGKLVAKLVSEEVERRLKQLR
jgi:Glu-tRNA(Gln) amidotransferase subunit E-like FAD-binding protein